MFAVEGPMTDDRRMERGRPLCPDQCAAFACGPSGPTATRSRPISRAQQASPAFRPAASCGRGRHERPLPTEIRPGNRLLTAAEFHRLADVPPEVEWFANISNARTRRVYENAVRDFMRFAGIARPEEFRTVTRAHVIAWRDDLMRRGLGEQHHTAPARLARLAVRISLREKRRHP